MNFDGQGIITQYSLPYIIMQAQTQTPSYQLDSTISDVQSYFFTLITIALIVVVLAIILIKAIKDRLTKKKSKSTTHLTMLSDDPKILHFPKSKRKN